LIAFEIDKLAELVSQARRVTGVEKQVDIDYLTSREVTRKSGCPLT
jgi:hypothetical protein